VRHVVVGSEGEPEPVAPGHPFPAVASSALEFVPAHSPRLAVGIDKTCVGPLDGCRWGFVDSHVAGSVEECDDFPTVDTPSKDITGGEFVDRDDPYLEGSLPTIP